MQEINRGLRNMLKTLKVVEEFMQYIVSTIQVVLISGPNQNHHYFQTFGLAHVRLSNVIITNARVIS